jgi:BASS family bile acid:Na+ symporter
MDLQQLIAWAFQLSIVAMVFALGLGTTTKDMRDLLRQPQPLGRSLLAIFVIVPVAAVILAHALDFPHAAEVALIALAISPLPPMIPRNLITAASGVRYPAAPLAAVALLSIVIVPLLAWLISHYLGPTFAVSPLRFAGAITGIVLLPLTVGMAIRALRPALADSIELPASLVGTVVLRLATLALFIIGLHAIGALIADGMVIAIAVLVVVGLVAGHLLGGPQPDGRTALALSASSRHPAVAFAAAAASSFESHFGAAIVLYLLLGDLFGFPYTIWRQRTRGQLTDAEAAAAILHAREKSVDDLSAGRSAPYYALPPIEEPKQSNGASLQSSSNSGDAARHGAASGERPGHANRDGAMKAFLAHLVGR